MKQQMTKPRELIIYEFLKGRMPFTAEQKIKLQNLQRGFQGEQLFSMAMKKNARQNFIPLYDVLLDNKGSMFQLDCLLIYQSQIIMVEIKNYHGEFILRDNHLYSCTADKEYRNPLHQLQRSEIQLREIFSKHRVTIPCTSIIVFINQGFTLFHAERDPKIILPTQLSAFFEKLNKIPGKITQSQRELAEKLKRLHHAESPYEQLPYYSNVQLRKGLLCSDCRVPLHMKKRKVCCSQCRSEETIDRAIMRNMNEFHILFANEKITTNNTYEWCDELISKTTIKRVLSRNMQLVKRNKYSYYTFL